MGPSILLSASCETVAFGLGALVGMPAVRNFAIYAAGAVVINALLQVTIFVSAMAVDLRRVEVSFSFTALAFPQANGGSPSPTGSTASRASSSRLPHLSISELPSPKATSPGSSVPSTHPHSSRSPSSTSSSRSSEDCLSCPGSVRATSSWVWVGCSRPCQETVADSLSSQINDSLSPPPPTSSTTLTPSTPSSTSAHRSTLSRATSTSPLERISSVFAVASRPATSSRLPTFSRRNESDRIPHSSLSLRASTDLAHLASPKLTCFALISAVWIDDFFQWLNPLLEDCCRVTKQDPSVFCTPDDPDFRCRPCFEDAEPAWNITMEDLPEGDDFMRYLDQWLISPTDESCPLGGKAGYSSALSVDDSSVKLSHFRTYHTPLKTQADFINAMAAAQRVARDLSRRTGADVFPYSLFYVFFDQCELPRLLPAEAVLNSTCRFPHRRHNPRSPYARPPLRLPRHESRPRLLANWRSRCLHRFPFGRRRDGCDGCLGHQPQRHQRRKPRRIRWHLPRVLLAHREGVHGCCRRRSTA